MVLLQTEIPRADSHQVKKQKQKRKLSKNNKKDSKNKKVLLCEFKRHTAGCVATPRYDALASDRGVPPSSTVGGYPIQSRGLLPMGHQQDGGTPVRQMEEAPGQMGVPHWPDGYPLLARWGHPPSPRWMYPPF